MEQADQFDLNSFQEKVFANYKVIARQFAKKKTFQDRVSFEGQLSQKTMIRRAFGRLVGLKGAFIYSFQLSAVSFQPQYLDPRGRF